MSSKRLDAVTQDALEAFWAVVAEAFPTAKTGDFGPDESRKIHLAGVDAVRTWLHWNMRPKCLVCHCYTPCGCGTPKLYAIAGGDTYRLYSTDVDGLTLWKWERDGEELNDVYLGGEEARLAFATSFAGDRIQVTFVMPEDWTE